MLAFATLEMVFPAHAGMSRIQIVSSGRQVSFPRSRGDEPPDLRLSAGEEAFSPLTRG
ncbi:hypothetical protein HMPREF1978_01873 [Actinomyces graevenitzii F0530]|uniref:Uncharacterized protein n=1 Tax=Actinomyces graevenitzii F0530 TaxID=1321817 RepID=U1PBX4_9ACTO|nr:hypothetical protein HMPREF1978_01873 [Actinomyces graevenitzii F0530]